MDSNVSNPVLLLALGLSALSINGSVFAQRSESTSNRPHESSAQRPASDSATKTPTSSRLSNQTSSVTADGVGATSDEALKDAFRNAVRQVVGAVVDGETLVKNDDLIKDKVLTYSDGFIKSYEEVVGSKKFEDGLHHVRVVADVERRSVIARLEAANVSITNVEGKNLFAEAVTRAEAKRNATELLKKALADLPALLTAEVVGKTDRLDYDHDASEIVLTISVKPDRKAYEVFARRLQETLRQVGVAKDSVVINGKAYVADSRRPAKSASNHKVHAALAQQKRSRSAPVRQNRPSKGNVPNSKNAALGSNTYIFEADRGRFVLAGPPIPEDKKDAWCIWVCSPGTGDLNLRWNAYVVEADKDEVLTGIRLSQAHLNGEGVVRRETGKVNERARTIVSVQFVGSDQKVVTDYEFELFANRSAAGVSYAMPPDRLYLSLLRLTVARDFPGVNLSAESDHPVQVFFAQRTRSTPLLNQLPRRNVPQTQNLFIAPYSFGIDATSLVWQKEQTYPRRVGVTLDQLKQIETVRCKITYTPSNNE